jgi:hypothetical protein
VSLILGLIESLGNVFSKLITDIDFFDETSKLFPDFIALDIFELLMNTFSIGTMIIVICFRIPIITLNIFRFRCPVPRSLTSFVGVKLRGTGHSCLNRSGPWKNQSLVADKSWTIYELEKFLSTKSFESILLDLKPLIPLNTFERVKSRWSVEYFKNLVHEL